MEKLIIFMYINLYLSLNCLPAHTQPAENHFLHYQTDPLQHSFLKSDMLKQLGKGFLQNFASMVPLLETGMSNVVQFYIFISPILILLYSYRKRAGVI